MSDRISPHFNRSEFACGCGCGYDTVDVELCEALEDVRVRFNSAVTVTSGCRCPVRNLSAGGAWRSLHKRGKAADFIVESHDPAVVQDYLEEKYPGKYGIGRYRSWTHLDVRPQSARW